MHTHTHTKKRYRISRTREANHAAILTSLAFRAHTTFTLWQAQETQAALLAAAEAANDLLCKYIVIDHTLKHYVTAGDTITLGDTITCNVTSTKGTN